MDPSDLRFGAKPRAWCLTRIFGVHNLTLAEDLVQDAVWRAVEVWNFRGMPENPAYWLSV
jgi:predicted RNA polymerase sigma factor